MNFNSKFWLKFSLLNLLIVALIGLLMRYKIGFEFPFLNQTYLLHSHSHFAFSGWINHTLMVLMILFLKKKNNEQNCFPTKFLKNYKIVLTANLVCSYGMLIFFTIEGYDKFSIFFSTCSLITSYFFSYYYIKDLRAISSLDLSKKWFKAALFFNIISSIGTFALAFMMATKDINQNNYFASIYYYLHFQYNGWFFFACMGLLFSYLNLKPSDNTASNKIFMLFFISCIPAYFLSVLWYDNLPMALYFLAVLAAIIQVYAYLKFLVLISKTKQNTIENCPKFLRTILYFIGFALIIKLALQLGSTVPTLSQLSFGFRPIVIAYLHLVLLAIISLFLLFYVFANRLLNFNKFMKSGLTIFTIGIVLNEITLATQGMAFFSNILFPFANNLLFVIAIVLVIGIAIMTIVSFRKVN